MALASVYSRAAIGIHAPLVKVEVHVAAGLPGFTIVGLPEASVRESRDRVRSALLNCHFEFPAKKIIVNLAPADLPKDGARFDLAIALGILVACNQIPHSKLEQYEVVGELGLSGEIRSVNACIACLVAAKQSGRTAIIPQANAMEASLVEGNCLLAESLSQLTQALMGQRELLKPDVQPPIEQSLVYPDMQDVIGQQLAKRALEIAAAGGHNILFMGPPGTGKTMLASRLAGILPQMTEDEALETATIHSVAGKLDNLAHWRTRPFRAPHHTCSAVALVGGGSQPRPGEVSLAHNGILFLDELPEFDRKVLEVLREPMESHNVTISRAARQAEYPARFQLVAAMNPTPCGHYNDPQMRSTPEQIIRYLNRLSGPFLDRIDIQIEVPKLPIGSLSNKQQQQESSEQIRQRVTAAREVQQQRSGKPNAHLSNRELVAVCQLAQPVANRLEEYINKLGYSARVYHRVLKVARTIADIQQQPQVGQQHIAEALGYRALERFIQRLNQ